MRDKGKAFLLAVAVFGLLGISVTRCGGEAHGAGIQEQKMFEILRGIRDAEKRQAAALERIANAMRLKNE